jgi:hypothetical protein
MQTIGEEQNIQTLFRELQLEDERAAPRFSVVWNSAQASTRPGPWFKPSFVVAAALLVVSLFSLALWLRERRRIHRPTTAVVIPSASPTVSPAPRALEATPNQVAPLRASDRANTKQRVMSLAARRRLRMLALLEAEIRSAAAVSSWQSPTAMLMQSPADDVLILLPQLYHSVTELNSFLPDTQQYKEK